MSAMPQVSGSGFRVPGYRMAAEWERHEATWLAWPHYSGDWHDKIPVIEWVYGEMVRKLAIGEKVRILAGSPAMERRSRWILQHAKVNPKQVQFYRVPTDRSWMRDTGPLFVRTAGVGSQVSGVRDNLAIMGFRFNAWARYPNWKKDAAISTVLSKRLRIPLLRPEHNGRPVVLEGGSIDVNGRGTLLTTEECLLSRRIQIRNPGFHRRDYEQIFRRYLGASHTLWLGRGIVGDDTHGHVDDLCRFVNPHTIVYALEKNARDANYRALQENRERLQGTRLANGKKPALVTLPMPAPLFFGARRLPASYANFYIGNAAVLVPTFNDPQDRVALGTLSELFPDRPVVGIHAVDLVLGRGTLHCLTQQQPAAGA